MNSEQKLSPDDVLREFTVSTIATGNQEEAIPPRDS